MVQAGFTTEELDLLRRAQDRSDSLVAIEETAMHAVRGEVRDASGAFTLRRPPDRAMAIRTMFDSAYHHQKARIMAPIDSFLAMAESRASTELMAFTVATARALRVIEAFLVLFLLVVLLLLSHAPLEGAVAGARPPAENHAGGGGPGTPGRHLDAHRAR